MGVRVIAAVAAASLLGGCSGSGVVSRPGEEPPGRPGETTVPPDVRRALQRELHELHLAQERYRATHERYAETLFDLRFTPSFGILVRLHEGTERGFSATAGRAPYECALFVGDVPPPRAYARRPSVIACEAAAPAQKRGFTTLLKMDPNV